MLRIDLEFRLVDRLQRMHKNRGREDFEIVLRGAAVGELGGDDLALLRHAHVSIDGAGGLGRDRAAGRCAAAAH